ncbi:hypothetical protein [Paraburkholderia dilworthii]|uniref:hypothetical protein n=1 Tax=Paraburkholderia dilworthii TaxID=948106 RepID=UPI00040992A3|nr:hypothetical protein [Paraburkholderia dilworthii]
MSARVNTNLSCVAVGQVALRDLRARSSVLAIQGDLQLAFRDHSLAWLGDAVPLTSITLHEGQCFVARQRGIVSISAAHAPAATFLVQPSLAEDKGSTLTSRAALQFARFLKTRLRRAA